MDSSHAPSHQGPGLSLEQIISRYWQQILFFLAIVIAMTVMMAVDLSALEAGKPKSARLWDPIISIYNTIGYWPTVILPLLLGGAIGAILLRLLMTRGTINLNHSAEDEP